MKFLGIKSDADFYIRMEIEMSTQTTSKPDILAKIEGS